MIENSGYAGRVFGSKTQHFRLKQVRPCCFLPVAAIFVTVPGPAGGYLVADAKMLWANYMVVFRFKYRPQLKFDFRFNHCQVYKCRFLPLVLYKRRADTEFYYIFDYIETKQKQTKVKTKRKGRPIRQKIVDFLIYGAGWNQKNHHEHSNIQNNTQKTKQ